MQHRIHYFNALGGTVNITLTKSTVKQRIMAVVFGKKRILRAEGYLLVTSFFRGTIYVLFMHQVGE